MHRIYRIDSMNPRSQMSFRMKSGGKKEFINLDATSANVWHIESFFFLLEGSCIIRFFPLRNLFIFLWVFDPLALRARLWKQPLPSFQFGSWPSERGGGGHKTRKRSADAQGPGDLWLGFKWYARPTPCRRPLEKSRGATANDGRSIPPLISLSGQRKDLPLHKEEPCSAHVKTVQQLQYLHCKCERVLFHFPHLKKISFTHFNHFFLCVWRQLLFLINVYVPEGNSIQVSWHIQTLLSFFSLMWRDRINTHDAQWYWGVGDILFAICSEWSHYILLPQISYWPLRLVASLSVDLDLYSPRRLTPAPNTRWLFFLSVVWYRHNFSIIRTLLSRTRNHKYAPSGQKDTRTLYCSASTIVLQ